MRTIPEFARAEWYTDPSDRRCPHNAWLDAVTISEIAEGTRTEVRSTKIVIRLLSAYQDGYIEFEYTGVTKCIMNSPDCRGGIGDWVEDNFVILGEDRLCHTISWQVGSSAEQTLWLIEADHVAYRRIEKNA